MHNNTFVRVAGRRVEYIRGRPEDPDMEVLPAMIWTEVQVKPLASVQFDIVDVTKQTLSRMQWIDGVVGNVVAFDGQSGEAQLVGEALRELGTSLFWLRTAGTTAITRPQMNGDGKWELSEDALASAFRARVESNQVLVDAGGRPETHQILKQGMRIVATPAMATQDPLARALAWATEIGLRLLVRPVVRAR